MKYGSLESGNEGKFINHFGNVFRSSSALRVSSHCMSTQFSRCQRRYWLINEIEFQAQGGILSFRAKREKLMLNLQLRSKNFLTLTLANCLSNFDSRFSHEIFFDIAARSQRTGSAEREKYAELWVLFSFNCLLCYRVDVLREKKYFVYIVRKGIRKRRETQLRINLIAVT